jgi:hypothetical protein
MTIKRTTIAALAILIVAGTGSVADALDRRQVQFASFASVARPGVAEKVLAISGASRFDGGNAILWDNVRQRDAVWLLEPVDPSARIFRLRNANSGKYLAVSGGSRRAGSSVIQWRNQGQRDIEWILTPETRRTGNRGGRCVTIRNRHSNLFLAVSGGAPRNGADVIQWQDVGQLDVVWCER